MGVKILGIVDVAMGRKCMGRLGTGLGGGQ